jgi:hypothetical protein
MRASAPLVSTTIAAWLLMRWGAYSRSHGGEITYDDIRHALLKYEFITNRFEITAES